MKWLYEEKKVSLGSSFSYLPYLGSKRLLLLLQIDGALMTSFFGSCFSFLFSLAPQSSVLHSLSCVLLRQLHQSSLHLSPPLSSLSPHFTSVLSPPFSSLSSSVILLLPVVRFSGEMGGHTSNLWQSTKATQDIYRV